MKTWSSYWPEGYISPASRMKLASRMKGVVPMEDMLSTSRLNSRERVREDPLVEEAYKATKKAIMNWRDLLRSLPDEYPAHEWISDFRKWLITCDAVYFDHMEALGMERDKGDVSHGGTGLTRT